MTNQEYNEFGKKLERAIKAEHRARMKRLEYAIIVHREYVKRLEESNLHDKAFIDEAKKQLRRLYLDYELEKHDI